MTEANELEFLRTYQSAIQHFNMLDRNLAYCLLHAANARGAPHDIKKILCLPFDTKLKRISALIGARKDEQAYKLFLNQRRNADDFEIAMVHGEWRYISFQEHPIHFHVPAPFDEKGEYDIQSFSEETSVFASCNVMFSTLRSTNPIELDDGPDNQRGH